MAALALALLTHIAALGFPFVDDDTTQIVGEPHVQSWHFFPQYFTQDIWSHKCGSNYYRPAFLTWILLNYTFFGLEPLGWHFSALLVHLLATGLVYALTERLCNDKTTAGFAALIFAVHPVAVESVVWVSGINEPLMTVMVIASLLGYFRARQQESTGWIWISALFFLTAAWVKETAVIVPLLVLFYEWKRGSGWEQRIANCKQVLPPYAAAGVLYVVGRVIALHGLAPAHSNNVPLRVVLSTWPAVLCFYLKQLVFPWPLGLYHTTKFVAQLRWNNFFLPLLIILLIAACLAAWSKRTAAVSNVGPWIFLPLLPVMMGMATFDRGQLVHDRYLYLPLAGFAVLGALALRAFSLQLPGSESRSRDIQQSKSSSSRLPRAQLAVLAVLICVFAVLTISETKAWSGSQALYRHAVVTAPDSAPANVAWAQELAAEDQPETAMSFYNKALAADPDDFRTYYSLGYFQGHSGQWEEAERNMIKVTQLKPNEPCVFFGLALVQESAGKLPEAEASLRRACATSPVPEGAHLQLASLLRQQGRVAEARRELKAELAVSTESEAREQAERLDEQWSTGPK